MKTNSPVERLYNGIIKENPTFVLMLGMWSDTCSYHFGYERTGNGADHSGHPTSSNLMISLLRKVIPTVSARRLILLR